MNKYHKHVCITSEIQDNAYDELMNWLESKCDSFSFCLPHFGKVVVTESNADIYPEYEIGYVEEDEERKKIMNSIGEECKNIWKIFPEDLSFYIDGELYMRSIAHERICEFYSESKELKRFLKKMVYNFVS